MTEQTHLDPVDLDPAQAFQELRGELTRLARLVDHLASAPDRVPNYSSTLANMEQSLKSLRERLARIEASPAVQMTHDALIAKIVELSQVIRSQDRQMIIDAANTIGQAVGRIDGIVERGQAVNRQTWQHRSRAAGLVAGGILIWSIIPGPLARSLPASWHVPEWMAERAMNLKTKDAGERLLSLARQREPEAFAVPEPTPAAEGTARSVRLKARQ